MVLAAHRELWADNGDALSRIYAGTGALNTSVTRSGGKRGWGALLSDASKSLGRAYQATFADQDKQMSIDLFLVSLYFSPSVISARICCTEVYCIGYHGWSKARASV